jgi:hypothetical protein
MVKSQFISDILDLMLDGGAEGISARNQLPFISENKFEYTGVGLCLNFSHDPESSNFKVSESELVLDGVKIETTEFPIECEARLVFTDGLINYLDIWSYYGEFPKHDLKKYTLKQIWKDSPGRTISTENTA